MSDAESLSFCVLNVLQICMRYFFRASVKQMPSGMVLTTVTEAVTNISKTLNTG